ncbi:hypothetical protein ABZ925_38250, partial [Streptomyces sp. NPDC046751]
MEDGLVGLARLVDHRSVGKRKEFGNAPDAVVAAMRQAIKEGVETSTRNGAYLIWRTGEIIRENGGDLAELPSRRTLYRLLDRLAAGTHATGSAVTRRSTAHGAAALFGELTVSAPGEFMQIDSTPLDVMVRVDDGVVGKVELTGMVDVASRTLTAAVLRPTTKSVDAGVLLARTVTPELTRPGWIDALKMYRSVLPHRRLLTIDERLEHAAAKPVIVPEMIVCDHGKVFVSHDFRASCRFLGDRLPAHAQGLAPRRRRTCGHCPNSRTCSMSGSSRSGRTGRTRGCVIPTTQDACSPPTRSTPSWSRPAATSRSRSAARTTSNSCPCRRTDLAPRLRTDERPQLRPQAAATGQRISV